MTKTGKKIQAQSILYYALRIVQRLSFLMTVATTIIHWIVMIVTVMLLEFRIQLQNAEFRNPQAINVAIKKTTNTLALGVAKWVVITAGVTFLMLLIPRVRRYEKRLVVDSILIVGFCMLSVALSQTIIRNFVLTYLAF